MKRDDWTATRPPYARLTEAELDRHQAEASNVYAFPYEPFEPHNITNVVMRPDYFPMPPTYTERAYDWLMPHFIKADEWLATNIVWVWAGVTVFVGMVIASAFFPGGWFGG